MQPYPVHRVMQTDVIDPWYASFLNKTPIEFLIIIKSNRNKSSKQYLSIVWFKLRQENELTKENRRKEKELFLIIYFIWFKQERESDFFFIVI